MIEKYIHYCWFGNKPLPKVYQKYIKTWKKFFPEYVFIERNEKNFPINDFLYAKEAYEAKKYAFVSDVARMYALYEYGGIYLDTDVEFIKEIDPKLLNNAVAIFGEESPKDNTFGTGFLAMKKGFEISKKFLNYYSTNHFVKSNGQLDLYSNTNRLADYIKEFYNLKPCNEFVLVERIYFFPQDYFTAYDGLLGKTCITANTICLHHFSNSWSSKYVKLKGKIRVLFNRILYCLQFRRS